MKNLRDKIRERAMKHVSAVFFHSKPQLVYNRSNKPSSLQKKKIRKI